MGTTERLVIDLPTHLVEGLRKSVKSGAFASESDAIEKLLRAWYGAEGNQQPDIETLRAFLAVAVADSDAGRITEAQEVYRDILDEIEKQDTVKR